MSRREAIIGLHQMDKSKTAIIKLLKASKSTVYHVINKFRKIGAANDRPRSGRLRSARTKKGVMAVREKVRRNPKRSIRKLAKDMRISNMSMRSIVERIPSCPHAKLGNVKTSQPSKSKNGLTEEKFFSESWKKSRPGQRLFSLLKKSSLLRPNSTVKNRALARIFQDIPEEVKIVFRHKKPSSVMEWSAVSKTWKFSLLFVEQGVKLNTMLLLSWYFGSSL